MTDKNDDRSRKTHMPDTAHTTGVCPACKKTMRDDKQKTKLLNRLKRMEGQLRGLQAMVEADAYCNDILIQSAAVGAAMDAFNRELLIDHVRTCVARDLRAGQDEAVDELCETLRRLMK